MKCAHPAGCRRNVKNGELCWQHAHVADRAALAELLADTAARSDGFMRTFKAAGK